MENTFKFRFYDDDFEVRFIKTSYFDGNLAIVVENREPELGLWDNFGNATVNLGHSLYEGEAYLDTNNMREMADFMMMKGWCETVGIGHSGYCSYPLVQFTSEFLEEICEEA